MKLLFNIDLTYIKKREELLNKARNGHSLLRINIFNQKGSVLLLTDNPALYLAELGIEAKHVSIESKINCTSSYLNSEVLFSIQKENSPEVRQFVVSEKEVIAALSELRGKCKSYIRIRNTVKEGTPDREGKIWCGQTPTDRRKKITVEEYLKTLSLNENIALVRYFIVRGRLKKSAIAA